MLKTSLVSTTLVAAVPRPALATAGMSGRARLVAGYLIGALGYASGLAFSAVFDLPSGALIVWTLCATAVLAQVVPRIRRSHPAQHEQPSF